MIALGGGSSYIQVAWEDLWNALRSRVPGETDVNLASRVTAAEVSGVVKRFVNDQGKTWLLLENPVQQSAPHVGVLAWARSLMSSWF
jgi:hypothetical protein